MFFLIIKVFKRAFLVLILFVVSIIFAVFFGITKLLSFLPKNNIIYKAMSYLTLKIIYFLKNIAGYLFN